MLRMFLPVMLPCNIIDVDGFTTLSVIVAKHLGIILLFIYLLVPSFFEFICCVLHREWREAGLKYLINVVENWRWFICLS